MSDHDKLYAQPLEAITSFVFDEQVVRIFRDMISRSVPGYATLISMLPVLVQKYVQPDSRCYDLGCSLGAASLAMRHAITQNNVSIIAVDNSQAMVHQLHTILDSDTARTPVDIVCEDIRNTRIHNASMVVMNFTLQFILPQNRLELLTSIYRGLKPGGVLVLSEKILMPDQHQAWMTDLHHAFKKANGYSDLEISQKRSALENVLIADSIETHNQRLHQAGFDQILPWFQCFNFVSMLAVK